MPTIRIRNPNNPDEFKTVKIAEGFTEVDVDEIASSLFQPSEAPRSVTQDVGTGVFKSLGKAATGAANLVNRGLSTLTGGAVNIGDMSQEPFEGESPVESGAVLGTDIAQFLAPTPMKGGVGLRMAADLGIGLAQGQSEGEAGLGAALGGVIGEGFELARGAAGGLRDRAVARARDFFRAGGAAKEEAVEGMVRPLLDQPGGLPRNTNKVVQQATNRIEDAEALRGPLEKKAIFQGNQALPREVNPQELSDVLDDMDIFRRPRVKEIPNPEAVDLLKGAPKQIMVDGKAVGFDEAQLLKKLGVEPTIPEATTADIAPTLARFTDEMRGLIKELQFENFKIPTGDMILWQKLMRGEISPRATQILRSGEKFEDMIGREELSQIPILQKARAATMEGVHRVIARVAPDLDELRKTLRFWSGVNEVAIAASRRSSAAGEIGNTVATGIAVAGHPMLAIQFKMLRGAIISQGWKSIRANGYNQISKAVASGNVQKLGEILSRLGVLGGGGTLTTGEAEETEAVSRSIQ